VDDRSLPPEGREHRSQPGHVREYRSQSAHYRSQPVELEAQIAFAELESYLESARVTLDREFARVEAQQRRITAMIESQDKARHDLQLRIAKQFGRTAAPRVPLRMPELIPSQSRIPESFSPQSRIPEDNPPCLPRMIETETIIGSQTSGEIERTSGSEKVRGVPQLIQREGNISDALSLTQVRIQTEKARMSLTSQLTLRITKKQRAQGTKKLDQKEGTRPITACMGWSV
jgi:hypothetical protein